MTGHKEIFETLRREILSGKFDAEKKLPSENTLAHRFGVSRPTISRVTLDLKREGLIITRKGAPSTITKFALNATGTLALVVPGESYAEIFRPLEMRLKKLAERAGWDLIHERIKSTDPLVRAREVRRLAYRLSREHVTGVILQPIEFIKDAPKANEETVRYFDEAGITVVLLDYDFVSFPGRSRYDVVGIDNFAAGFTIADHLLKTGSGRIAYLHRPCAAPTVTDRMRGVASAVIEAGLPWSLAENVLRAEPTNRRAVAKFIRRFNPDTFIAGNDIAAVELGETLRRMGNGAENIKLAGFDDVEAAEKAGITTMRQPLDDIALIAIQTMISRIREPGMPIRTTLLPASLVIRR